MFAVSLIFFMLLSLVSTSASAAAPIKVHLNGQRLDFDVLPIIEGGRTMVPFRRIGEALGASVHWDNDHRTIYAHKDGKKVVLKIGSKTAYIDDNPVALDIPALIKNGRTLLPLRFFGEAFGAKVAWRDDLRTVFIDTSDKLSRYILGYYYSGSYDDFLQNHDKLSSVAAKWYTTNEEGNLVSQDTARYIAVPKGYEKVIETAKSNGIGMYMLVFESNAERLEKIMATSDSREKLQQQILDVVKSQGYSGVNIDFEYLKASDRERFNIFIKDLYTELRENHKRLSISLPVKTEEADWWPGYDFKTLGTYSDYVVLMAYDKNPANPEPQSGVDWVEKVVDYALARIPAEKIVLGIGYYGYEWSPNGRRTVLPFNSGLTYSGVTTLDELKQKYGLKMNIDDKSKMAYGSYIDENGIFREIWAESDVSVDAKTKMTIQKGLKGIALWRLGYTTPDFWETVNKNFAPIKY